MDEMAPADQQSTSLAPPLVGMGRRLLIFGLLGPAIGWVVMALLLMIPAVQSLGAVSRMLMLTVGVLPIAYVIGLIPAIITGLFDALFAEQRVKWRPVWTAVAGFFATLLTVTLPGWVIGTVSPGALLYCALGAISGFLCAALCADPKRR
ncbi:hypothetical protein [Plastoroseomonas hellenica]|uniref:hypothetical protein n=1 Tax=Plastoroseomonas hellenica TaxID=2687306 RepID=UPI001BA93090|nr:hypothetical protein [Plastoroseomonas hellenica]MBR0647121.1 hypothetical protein [Plastoroseomonas hellenica]